MVSSSSLYRSSFFSGYGLNKFTSLRSSRRWQKPFDARLEATSHEIDWPRMLSIFAKMMKQALGESSSVTPNLSLKLKPVFKTQPIPALTKLLNGGMVGNPHQSPRYDYKTLCDSIERCKKPYGPLGAFLRKNYNRNMLDFKVPVGPDQEPLSLVTSLGNLPLEDNVAEQHSQKFSSKDFKKKQVSVEQDSDLKSRAKVSPAQQIVWRLAPPKYFWPNKSYWWQTSSKKTFDESQNPPSVSNKPADGQKILFKTPTGLFK